MFCQTRGIFIRVLKKDEKINPQMRPDMLEKWETEQRQICDRYKSRFVPVVDDARIGGALATMSRRPLHGLRHRTHGNMEGWYIWGGDYSEDPNFFDVLHAKHFISDYHDLIKYL